MKHLRILLLALLSSAAFGQNAVTWDLLGNATFNGNLTVNGQLNVAGPWAVSSPIPGTAFGPAPLKSSSFGVSNDGNFYMSNNGSTPAKVLTSATLAKVATSGSYLDLLNLPVIPAAQINSDWNAAAGLAQILNKPTIPAPQVQTDWNLTAGMGQLLNKPTLSKVATSGSYLDLLNSPVIPAAQVNSDWNATAGLAQILNKPAIPVQVQTDWNAAAGMGVLLNKPALAKVATSGSYTDLLNPPVIPAAQINSDWNATAGLAQILNKPVIPAAQVNADWNATAGVAVILNKPAPVAAGTVLTGTLTCAGEAGKNIPSGFSTTCTFTVTSIVQ